MQAGPVAAGIPLLAGSQSGALLPRHPLDVTSLSLNSRNSLMALIGYVMQPASQTCHASEGWHPGL